MIRVIQKILIHIRFFGGIFDNSSHYAVCGTDKNDFADKDKKLLIKNDKLQNICENITNIGKKQGL